MTLPRMARHGGVSDTVRRRKGTVEVKRSEARNQFLTDVLVTAIENYGMGWFYVHEYVWDCPLGEAYAIIEPDGEPETTYRVTLDTLAHGLSVIRCAKPIGDTSSLANAKTGKPLYMSQYWQREIMLSDRTNGDDGDLDVLSALAILECGLFGAIVYG